MEEFTDRQKDLITLAEKGANDAHLILLDKIHELEDKINEIKMPDLEEVLASVRGKEGKEGEIGPKGEKGDMGEKGERGPQGQTGANGAKGERGERGFQGEDGKDGTNGKDGKDGKDGEKGEKGEKGESGSSRSLIGGGFSKIAMDGHIVDNETPTGTVNGVNTDFVLANTPNPANSLKIYVNGQRMQLTGDYTISVKTITFLTAPPTTSIILCDYKK
jgi:hypothetical protein